MYRFQFENYSLIYIQINNTSLEIFVYKYLVRTNTIYQKTKYI